jgi:Mlc titration factor MtfA (ptsG expression regulator)
MVDSLPADAQKNVRQLIDSINNVVSTQPSNNDATDNILRSNGIVAFLAILLILAVFWQQGFFNRLKETDRKKFISFFIITLALSAPSIIYHMWLFAFILFIAVIVGLREFIKATRLPEDNAVASTYYDDNHPVKKLTYEGSQLNFSIPTIHTTLIKHWPYFSMLESADKDKFGERLKQFIDIKTYDIYDDSGFIEMPILISAAAIQITFGLDDFLLKDFPVINIYPDAFFSSNPFPRFLEGNVSNSCINLSWKHFLQGINCYTDGDNVGLHEMAHALYSHEFIQKTHADNFCKTYEEFNDYGTKVFSEGKTADDDLYCNYAFRNIQEFWAVSIELFFERPSEMKTKFPTIYTAITDILNQDPANKITVLKSA